MALATQCPHCHTKFRVAADQLKLRGGIVRCGACQSIFDGNAHLVDLDAPGRKDAAPAGTPSPPFSPFSPVGAPAGPVDAIEPVESVASVETLDDAARDVSGVASDALPDVSQDLTPEPRVEVTDADMPAYGTSEDVADAVPFEAGPPEPESEPDPGPAPEPSHEPAPEPPPVSPASVPHDPPGRIEPSFGLQPDAAPAGPEPAPEPAPPLPARPAVHDDIPLAALPLRASAVGEPSLAGPASSLPAAAPDSKRARALDARARRSKLTPTRIDAPKLRVPESDEPEFVKRSRRQERSGRTQRILMAAGAVVLLLALAAQALLMGRDVLAARYPAARPLLGALCGVAGCRVGLPTQVENLSIETGELSPLGPGTYSLNTLLRNQGNLVQTWPSIELELVDDDNKPLLRRVFGPADYLPPAQTAGMQAAGFAARSEQPIRIDFALAGPTPAGYHLFVFYP